MKKNQLKISYFTRSMLIEAAAQGRQWDYNRQISEAISEVPDLNYPVTFSMDHHHRHGQRCEPHIRCQISLSPFANKDVLCDVPTDFFEKLPRIRMKSSVI